MASHSRIHTLTAERARELLTYDTETGILVWNESRGCVSKGKVAGFSEGPNRYLGIRIDAIQYRIHQICFLMAYGRFAKGDIDHINGDKTDNRLSNLREVSRSMNLRNAKLPAHNKSGVVGVFWNTGNQRWTARVKVNQKNIHLGDFVDFDQAVAARKKAAAMHGFTERHGSNELRHH